MDKAGVRRLFFLITTLSLYNCFYSDNESCLHARSTVVHKSLFDFIQCVLDRKKQVKVVNNENSTFFHFGEKNPFNQLTKCRALVQKKDTNKNLNTYSI